mgnify:CR=1 FL=1
MTNLTAILTIAILVICFVTILVILDIAVGEVMDNYDRQNRAEEREQKLAENAAWYVKTREQDLREDLFRAYVREVDKP